MAGQVAQESPTHRFCPSFDRCASEGLHSECFTAFMFYLERELYSFFLLA